ncbi:MAG TPA: DotU family type IV/VI secretion system protein [Candidatus Acidoferrum sp.]
MGATLFGATSMQPTPPQPTSRRRDNLALVFQNLLTVIVRLRANRQVISDSQAFRVQMQSALRAAEREGIKKLYSPEDVRLATFAIVAFLDESIRTSNNPVFADWSGRPLQEEMFGHQRAGEVFFENIERLLSRGDSHSVSDVLEIYSLCILLGYKGKYGLGDQDSVRPVLDAIAEKIRRIRGPLAGLSPSWAIPEGTIQAAQTDPWIRRLALGALAGLLIVLLFFALFKIMLDSDASRVHALAAVFGTVGI